MARAFTGRNKILKFEGAYHGNHDYAAVSQFPAGAGQLSRRQRRHRRRARCRADQRAGRALQRLDAVEAIVKEHADDLAAIIVEPVQRIIFPQARFLEGLRSICDRHGVC